MHCLCVYDKSRCLDKDAFQIHLHAQTLAPPHVLNQRLIKRFQSQSCTCGTGSRAEVDGARGHTDAHSVDSGQEVCGFLHPQQ